jgi:hypothetical protein
VTSTEGNPFSASSETVEWRPRLGSKLSFRASAGAFNAGALLAIGGGLVVVIVLVVRLLTRSRAVSPSEPAAPAAAEVERD